MASLSVYRDIAEQIRIRWIVGAALAPGARLPSEREFHQLLGVSRMTVGRALALLEEQGLIERRRGSGSYVRDAPPGPLPPIAAFITPFLPDPSAVGGPLPMALLCGVERRGRELGYQVMAASAGFSVQAEQDLIERFRRLGVAGIILQPVDRAGGQCEPSPALDPVARRWRDLPIVVADLGCEEWGRPMVQIDNYRLGFDMTQALLKRGHRHILFMDAADDQRHRSIHERRRGWERAMQIHGEPIPIAYRGWPRSPAGYKSRLEPERLTEVVKDLLALSPRPDAVIAWEDAIAMQLIGELIRLKVAVPWELRVTGFDNHAVGRRFEPAFPTSNPDFAALGEAAMDLLDQMVTGTSVAVRTIVLPARVLWREPAVRRI